MSSVDEVVIVYDFSFINGGQAKVAIESAIGLAQAGLKVTFFAACGPADGRLRLAGIDVICLSQADILSDGNRLRAATQGLWNREAAEQLRRLLRAKKPETTVIHCHGFSKALSASIGPVLASPTWRVVYTCHEYFLTCPNGGFFDYQAEEMCRRTPLGASCLTTNCDSRSPTHKAWRVVRQLVQSSVGRLPSGLRDLIYISETQMTMMGTYIPATTRLHYVSNPVELDASQPRVEVENNDCFLYVGRLAAEKGVVDFAIAAKEAGVRAVFVGSGPEEARVRAVNSDATITGWATPDVVGSWLRRARCLVFPSLWSEGQPLVPMEALALGVPVITNDWNAAAEVVRDGENGSIYKARSELTTHLHAMSRDLALALSRNAYADRHRIGNSVAQHVSSLLGVYQQLPLGR